MKILFWNIGPKPDSTQNTFIDLTIADINPDILCLAEGSIGGVECTALVKQIEALGYSTIYEPNFHSGTIVNGQYGFNKNGLKIFKKNGLQGAKKFAFWDQNLEGRILQLRFKHKNENYSCFFIHNMSKVNDEIKQYNFMIRLNMFLSLKRRLLPDEKFFICGDFNLLPWEKMLRNKETIKSYFFEKEYTFYNAKGEKDKYYNPFFEYCLKHKNNLMFATHHGKKFNELLDFALFSGGMNNYDIEIAEKTNGIDLLSSKNKKISIHNNFDHLPIIITLK